MYLHDIGYSKLLKRGYTLEDYKNVKEKHQVVGAKEAKKILKELDYPKDIDAKIVGLVRNQNRIAQLRIR